ncbi:MAG: hypothetical protein ABSF70_09560 [Terracidiphilus sp.]|jgi:hypothetical protein
MRNLIQHNSPTLSWMRRARVFAQLTILVAIPGGARMLAGQAPPTPVSAAAPASPAHKPAHSRKHIVAPVAQPAPVVQALALPVAPPAPELPLWPANDKPTQANVTWDSQGLRIDAANSSLRQILRDVAAATGAKVEGLESDERVFGAYGPGPASSVLSQLLQGCDYNVMMVGDQGQGTPREIVLSSRHTGGATTPPGANPNPNQASDDDSAEAEDAQQQQPAPPPQRPEFGRGRGPMGPQQLQEIQQRQQQMRQMSGSSPAPQN